MEKFSAPNKHHQLTTIHHDPTTNSPSKNHTLHPAFPKTPLKNAHKTTKPRLSPGVYFFLRKSEINQP
jgi:hypothetical protein